ncbi:MAG: HAD-IIIA family hydrolase [Bacteroidetes bacterium]|nr:HAD-IIIA family hydrolase [Bacteroidota bacterium]
MSPHNKLPDVGCNWSLFLDRDGVINQRPPGDYVRNISGFVWLPGVLDAIANLSGIFGRIVVVTNQQGVGLGLMSKTELDQIHAWMQEQIALHGGKIDLVLCCTMRKDEPENCRKPGLSMAMQAKSHFPEIDFSRSFMVGDTESDIIFGRNAGMLTVMVGDEACNPPPDFRVSSLAEFAGLFMNKTI